MNAEQLRQARNLVHSARRIVVISGAGLSTSAGIPDFRTAGTGLYDNLQRYNLPFPEAIFDLAYFQKRPQPFFHLARELLPGHYQPTEGHRFIKRLETQGKLLRLYTQNIDGLERLAGIAKLVECHGTFATATCQECRRHYVLADISGPIEQGQVPLCACPRGGVIKPDVVFFGEALPDEFHLLSAQDLPRADLLIAIGTSMTVYPVAALPQMARKDVPVLFINRDPAPMQLRGAAEVLGEIDEVVKEL